MQKVSLEVDKQNLSIFFVCDSFYGEPHIVDSKYKHILKDANKQGNFRLGKRKSSCTMNLHALHYDIIIELEII
jgi:hypothetical protein